MKINILLKHYKGDETVTTDRITFNKTINRIVFENKTDKTVPLKIVFLQKRFIERLKFWKSEMNMIIETFFKTSEIEKLVDEL